MEALWHEYEAGSTPEAQLVKDFDKVGHIVGVEVLPLVNSYVLEWLDTEPFCSLNYTKAISSDICHKFLVFAIL